MSDFTNDNVDSLVEGRGPSSAELGIKESNLGSAGAPVYTEQSPPPLGDKAAVERHEKALIADERNNAVRFEQGLAAAQESMKNVSGARVEVGTKFDSGAGKEIPVVNTYTPDKAATPKDKQPA